MTFIKKMDFKLMNKKGGGGSKKVSRENTDTASSRKIFAKFPIGFFSEKNKQNKRRKNI